MNIKIENINHKKTIINRYKSVNDVLIHDNYPLDNLSKCKYKKNRIISNLSHELGQQRAIFAKSSNQQCGSIVLT